METVFGPSDALLDRAGFETLRSRFPDARLLESKHEAARCARERMTPIDAEDSEIRRS
jgi:hypothetical protein